MCAVTCICSTNQWGKLREVVINCPHCFSDETIDESQEFVAVYRL